jgi:nucleoside-diphosphate-sugar epimerase
LKQEDFWVRGVDLKYPEFSKSVADDFVVGDLRDLQICRRVMDKNVDEVYQLAADMGGAGYLFVGDNDAEIMHNSALINLNVLRAFHKQQQGRIFYASSACVYPQYNQEQPDNINTSEDSVYPALPDSEYGWEKLFSEHIYMAFHRNYGIKVHIARYHNIFGPEGAWNNGREKVLAALCRKVALARNRGQIEIWGDGKQMRSFLYIDDCLDATLRLMRSNWTGPVNIGSEEMISINQLAEMIMQIAGKKLSLKHIPGPQGVRARKSDNRLILKNLKWRPKLSLIEGLKKTYPWIHKQVIYEKKDNKQN